MISFIPLAGAETPSEEEFSDNNISDFGGSNKELRNVSKEKSKEVSSRTTLNEIFTMLLVIVFHEEGHVSFCCL